MVGSVSVIDCRAGRESGERDAVCVGRGASCACVWQVVAPRAAFTSRSIKPTWDLVRSWQLVLGAKVC